MEQQPQVQVNAVRCDVCGAPVVYDADSTVSNCRHMIQLAADPAPQPPFPENEMRLARFLIARFADRLDPNAESPIDTAIEILNEYADLCEKASTLKPYVSARVIYHGRVSAGSVVQAALITSLVDDDGMVNLSVFPDGGGIFFKARVTQGRDVGDWDWPAQA